MIVYCRNCGQPININNTGLLNNPRFICPNCGMPIMQGGNYCYKCGKPTFPTDRVCINCGSVLKQTFSDWLTTLLLAVFLGTLGVHRFYTRNYITGLLQLITLGGLGVWTLIDIIRILTGDFKDGYGNPIPAPYNKTQKI